jgi:hypothetical protein
MPRRPARYGIIFNMADDPVDKFLAEQKTLEAHRHELIKEVLRQKEAAIKAFDEKLAKLGYDGDHAPKRSHHKDDADKKAPE